MDKQGSALTIWLSVSAQEEERSKIRKERDEKEMFLFEIYQKPDWKGEKKEEKREFAIKSQVTFPLTASQLACNYSYSEAESQRSSCSKK